MTEIGTFPLAQSIAARLPLCHLGEYFDRVYWHQSAASPEQRCVWVTPWVHFALLHLPVLTETEVFVCLCWDGALSAGLARSLSLQKMWKLKSGGSRVL